MRLRLTMIFLLALFCPFGSEVEAARFCSTEGGRPPNCSYDTSEQCRAANQGKGRCVPEEWLEKKATTRAARPKPAKTEITVRDIYLGPLGRYGSQDVPQMYNYDSGPNRHNASSWIGNGNSW